MKKKLIKPMLSLQHFLKKLNMLIINEYIISSESKLFLIRLRDNKWWSQNVSEKENSDIKPQYVDFTRYSISDFA